MVLGVMLMASGTGVNGGAALSDGQRAGRNGYVASQDPVQQVFTALSVQLARPVVLSQRAQRRQISGEIVLDSPWERLARLCSQLGLIWYYDGNTVYVYDAAEIRRVFIRLRSARLATLRDFLQQAGLYDRRYPLRADSRSGGQAFYLTGPPVYVELATQVAASLDQESGVDPASARQQIAVIRLQNSFVDDRSYQLRGQPVTVLGIASALKAILPRRPALSRAAAASAPQAGLPPSPVDALPDARVPFNLDRPLAPPVHALAEPVEPLAIQPFAASNSLLVRGRPEEVEQIRQLVQSLDAAKQHVELALWIIDISKTSLDSLGVNWSASARVGDVGLSLNSLDQPVSTLDGQRFLLSVKALSQQGKAEIVTRPVVLTQENVPAIFDNNETFYVPLQGERVAQLQAVTYGTLISVLPRINTISNEIEMLLNIEDGSSASDLGEGKMALPKVHRTLISTIARVPVGKSLLVGGYSRSAREDRLSKIPVLGDLPVLGSLFRQHTANADDRLRLFLIEPRLLAQGAGWDSNHFDAVQNPGPLPALAKTLDKLRDYLDRHALH